MGHLKFCLKHGGAPDCIWGTAGHQALYLGHGGAPVILLQVLRDICQSTTAMDGHLIVTWTTEEHLVDILGQNEAPGTVSKERRARDTNHIMALHPRGYGTLPFACWDT